jgi:hypothetical protein
MTRIRRIQEQVCQNGFAAEWSSNLKSCRKSPRGVNFKTTGCLRTCGTGFANQTPRSGAKTQTDSLLSRVVDLLRQQVVGLGLRRLRRRAFGKPCPALCLRWEKITLPSAILPLALLICANPPDPRHPRSKLDSRRFARFAVGSGRRLHLAEKLPDFEIRISYRRWPAV